MHGTTNPKKVITYVKQIFKEAIPLRLLLNKLHPSLELKLVDI